MSSSPIAALSRHLAPLGGVVPQARHGLLEVLETGAQVVCATHSPILASTPGADIIEVGEHGLRRAKWGELQIVDHWRRYLENPDIYLRHLTES